MTEERLPSIFAFILHADVVGSTKLVRQDEQIAHSRIQDAFARLSESIASYSGVAHEVRGDAVVGVFERASDAVSAAIAFQLSNARHNNRLTDGISPDMRIGVAMGEGVMTDHTMTGLGVVLAQRLEQSADPGGVVIQGAVYEAIPKRLPFAYQTLGELRVNGFDEPVRAYVASLAEGKEVPPPEAAGARVKSFRASSRTFSIGAAAVLLVAIGLSWVAGWLPEWIMPSPHQPETRLENKPLDRGIVRAQGLQTVKAGHLNIQLRIPKRWSAQVREADVVGFIDKEYRPGPQEVVLEDKENRMDVRIFKWYHPPATDTDVMHGWIQDAGVRRLLVEHLLGRSYKETRRTISKGNLGSGEEMTVISLTLDVAGQLQYVRIAYVIRGKVETREFIVFFFSSGGGIDEIVDDELTMITGSTSMMFDPM